VEIYKGKPIFYGVSNFFNQLGQEALAATPGGERSAAEEGADRMTWVTQDSNLEALLTTSRYEGGKLVEVRLYPADLGQGRSRPLSRTGIPMTPSPETARKILEKLQALSKPFGTTIAIENNIGVIRVTTSSATSR
jgi:poly-gamma-glutamate synthesis protein (capsule biosynthesis protein)